MEILLVVLAALTLTVVVLGVVVFRSPGQTPLSFARPNPNVFTLYDRLRPGDRILWRQKLNRVPKVTVFQGWARDGRMVCRTTPFCREFRAPSGDLIRLVA